MSVQEINLVNATRLEQIKKVNLFKMITVDQNEIYMCDTFTVENFLGDEYPYVSCAIQGAGQSFTNEYVRPTFNFENPNFRYNQYVLGKNLDYAQIVHYEMQFAYEGDPEAQVISTSVWQVYQVAAVSTQISLKLRALSDCPNTNTPPRAYYAPEFSSVNS